MSTVRIQVRRGVAADWTSVNPILAAGEMGYETDTNKFKFGNGSGTWSTLSYGASDTPGVTEIAQDAINSALVVGTGLTKTYNDGANTITVAINDAIWANKTYVDGAVAGLSSTVDSAFVPESDKGIAFGVASLDSTAKIPAVQISDTSVRNKISASGNGIAYNSTTGALSLDFSAASTSVASQGYVATQIANTVNGAPGALDTLLELSNALGSDANFATTVTNSLSTKSPIASPTFTGTVTIPAGALISGYDLQANREAAVTSALATAAADAQTKATAATTAATTAAATDATTKAAAAQAAATAAAATDATTKANTAKSEAVTVASTDATTKSANAKSEAIATAAADATTKADAAAAAASTDATTKAATAKSEALAGASADATTKANAAQSAATTAATTAAAAAADTKIGTHNSVTTNVHGISDTAELATKSYADTAIALKAPLASPTFTGTVSGITKTMVGLGSVDNTADSAKPISTAAQTELNLKAPLASPALTGVPTAPTAAAATNTTQVATTAYVRGEVAALVNSAGATLDTLGEIATALGNDANLSTTLTNAIALKAPLASPTFTGTNTVANMTVSGTTNLSANGVQLSDGTQTKVGVPSITTISQKTASYTLAGLTERDSMIEMNSASATTLTVPTNATIAYPVGTSIDVLRVGAGAVDVAAAVGVTVNATPGLKLRAQWSSATLIKRATDTWVLVGDLSA